MDKNFPEFEADEVNRLSALARREGGTGEYYTKCHKLVLSYLDGASMSLAQRQWLWGIKRDLKEDE